MVRWECMWEGLDSLHRAAVEKVTKYKTIAAEACRLSDNDKVKCFGFVLGARGVFDEDCLTVLKELGFGKV